VGALGWLLYGVRFLLELTGLAAVAFWGVRTGGSLLSSVALAVAAPLALLTVWRTFVAPTAPRRLAGPARLGVELVVFGLAAAALVDAGLPDAGIAFGAVALLDSVAVFVYERRGGTPPGE
jgi:multisubunit Na+/H+ antiporter MnhF subunit